MIFFGNARSTWEQRLKTSNLLDAKVRVLTGEFVAQEYMSSGMKDCFEKLNRFDLFNGLKILNNL